MDSSVIRSIRLLPIGSSEQVHPLRIHWIRYSEIPPVRVSEDRRSPLPDREIPFQEGAVI